MKINLGSGKKRFEGFKNVDDDPSVDPDFLVNLNTESLPFQDNSISEVKAHHILEHIGDGFFFFLKELYRVCEHEAIIDVHVPHPRHDYFLGDLTHVRPITIENMRPLSKKWCDSQSYINSSWSGLANVLRVDFEIFEYSYKLDETFEKLYGNLGEEEVNWLARAMNNSISEIHFKMMAIKNDL
jgi:ubiquinone/menaquinone biosynthesis C-methylase UbiE